jgi:hypothetical protein
MKHEPLPQSYDTAVNKNKDVLALLQKERQRLEDKLEKWRTQPFPGHKYRNSEEHRTEQKAIRGFAKVKRKVKKHEEHKAKKEAKKKAKAEAKAEAERIAKEAEEARIEKLKEFGRAKMEQILNRPKPVPKPEPEPQKSSIWKVPPKKRARKRK